MPLPATTHFSGASTLILGGGKGIGAAVSRELGRRGARVVVADIDLAAAEATAAAIRIANGEALAVTCDVTDASSIDAVATTAEQCFGEIDILVNNVGTMIHGAPEDIPPSEWLRLVDINVFSMMRGLDRVLPKMLSRGSGHIVNTASFAGLLPYAATRLPYAASKAAIINATQNLAIHAEPKGVRISCFIPGPVMTGIQDAMKTWGENTPMRGPGSQYSIRTVDEVAAILADGMEQGRIMISTDEQVWDELIAWARNPDAYVRAKIVQFDNGDPGLPSAEAIAALMKKDAQSQV